MLVGGRAKRLPVIVVISSDAGSCHGYSWDRNDNLLSLTLDVTTARARHIGVDLLEDCRGRSSNDLLLGLSVRVTWLHARQEARRSGGVDDKALVDVVGEDVNELISRSRRRSGLLSILTAKVGVDLELQLGCATLGDEGLQEVRDGLVGLAECLDQVDREVLVAVAVEGGGETAVADASGAAWEGVLVGGSGDVRREGTYQCGGCTPRYRQSRLWEDRS